jgi:hypothetical protein
VPKSLEWLCGDGSVLLRDILKRRGVSSRILAGTYGDSKEEHAWLETCDGTIMDVCENLLRRGNDDRD